VLGRRHDVLPVDRRQQELDVRPLGDECVDARGRDGAGHQGVLDRRVGDQPHLGADLAQAARRGPATAIRHADVDHRHLGLQLSGQLDGVGNPAGGADHRQAVVGLDEGADRLEHHPVIVEEEHGGDLGDLPGGLSHLR